MPTRCEVKGAGRALGGFRADFFRVGATKNAIRAGILASAPIRPVPHALCMRAVCVPHSALGPHNPAVSLPEPCRDPNQRENWHGEARMGKPPRFHATRRLPISVPMPTYCYRDPAGKLVEITMSLADKAEREREGVLIDSDGTRLTRDVSAEHAPRRGNAFCGANWPMQSDALGVQPDEIPSAMEDARRRGVNLNFTRDGRAILESPAHRRQAMRAYGYMDKAGYC